MSWTLASWLSTLFMTCLSGLSWVKSEVMTICCRSSTCQSYPWQTTGTWGRIRHHFREWNPNNTICVAVTELQASPSEASQWPRYNVPQQSHQGAFCTTGIRMSLHRLSMVIWLPGDGASEAR
ncbi:hypothetical protein B0H65DRAFT_202453 [Neurospora tetraspora]|uniref:Secreted protein n=1 Tax=Neurospora tetraspora TaxID=94610 RepID=A0AAE0JFQ0_9PEZI|nr:hypothetical protein B0H65DRAFT_202453 [Neurospora tetraspora]